RLVLAADAGRARRPPQPRAVEARSIHEPDMPDAAAAVVGKRHGDDANGIALVVPRFGWYFHAVDVQADLERGFRRHHLNASEFGVRSEEDDGVIVVVGETGFQVPG